MHIYQKIMGTILIFLGSQSSHPLTLEPIQIRSTIGELLYLEIPFQYANLDESIRVNLAHSYDLDAVNIKHQPPPHLNFFILQKKDGTGMITITSSTPFYNNTLNFVLKIQEGLNKRLHHVQQTLYQPHHIAIKKSETLLHQESVLSPMKIHNEQEIALHLFQSPNLNANTPHHLHTTELLKLSPNQPPALRNTWLVSNINKPNFLHTKHENPLTQTYESNQVLQISNNPPPLLQSMSTATIKQKSLPQNNNDAIRHNMKYTVQKNETLWLIASKISNEYQASVADLMKQIKINNRHAFIQGNVNKLRNGAILTFNISNKTTLSVKKMKEENYEKSAIHLSQAPNSTANIIEIKSILN